MMKARLRLLDTEALAHHYRVSTGTIRRWACEDRWQPYGSRKNRLWSMTAAQASWEARHAHDSEETCA